MSATNLSARGSLQGRFRAAKDALKLPFELLKCHPELLEDPATESLLGELEKTLECCLKENARRVLDPFEKWATSGGRQKDAAAFTPTKVLWQNYSNFCAATKAAPQISLRQFHKELKKRCHWPLRKGKTFFRGSKTEHRGWWGIFIAPPLPSRYDSRQLTGELKDG